MKRLLSAAALAALALLVAGTTSPRARAGGGTKPYTFVRLGTLGAIPSVGHDVNDAGEVVGYSYLADGSQHAFYWRDVNGNNLSDPGEMVDLGPLGNKSSAFRINNLGEAVGWTYVAGNGAVHAAYWNTAAPTPTPIDLNSLLQPADAANWMLKGADSINDNRQVSGFGILAADGLQHGFVLDLNTGTITDLGIPAGKTSSVGVGLNNLSPPLVAGAAGGGYLFSPGAPAISLSPMDVGYAVNDNGQVAGRLAGQQSPGGQPYNPGYWKDTNGNGIADPGEFVALGDFGRFTAATVPDIAHDINATGMVVGTCGAPKAENGAYTSHAFRWQAGTPPSSKQDLNSLTTAPFVLREGWGISNTGYVTGWGSATGFYYESYGEAYLLKPN